MTQPIHPMLERVADDMEDAFDDARSKADMDWMQLPESVYRALARAAVQALMEPDEGMLSALIDGEHTHWGAGMRAEFYGTRENMEENWKAALRPLVEEGRRQPVPGVYRDGQVEG